MKNLIKKISLELSRADYFHMFCGDKSIAEFYIDKFNKQFNENLKATDLHEEAILNPENRLFAVEYYHTLKDSNRLPYNEKSIIKRLGI